LIGLRLPKEYGGQEAEATTMAVAVEELARAGWLCHMLWNSTESFDLGIVITRERLLNT